MQTVGRTIYYVFLISLSQSVCGQVVQRLELHLMVSEVCSVAETMFTGRPQMPRGDRSLQTVLTTSSEICKET